MKRIENEAISPSKEDKKIPDEQKNFEYSFDFNSFPFSANGENNYEKSWMDADALKYIFSNFLKKTLPKLKGRNLTEANHFS
jgi:hypothetical protein